MTVSRLTETLARLSSRAASSVVARGRIASPALNAALLRRLSARPGETDALLADPVFEIAQTWEPTEHSLDDLSGEILHPDLVAALDEAEAEQMPRDTRPWSHQLAAWEAAHKGLSCLVSSGTGSGKTECFMIPILDALLRDPSKGLLSGVRAIVIYPLNALIESQRERLAAWTAPMKDRLRFALYNGLTPETRKKEDRSDLADAEIGNRRDIRKTPPAILVTNITMLEYLLLRAADRSILEHSQGLLRWVVLDEAHGYIGAQAAEMALLLRRVRAAFGVKPDQVQLMATSATIGEEDGAGVKLKRFASDLAGVDENRVQVIRGRTVEPSLPPPGKDELLNVAELDKLEPAALWKRLAPHPRIQKLQQEISKEGKSLSEISEILFDSKDDSWRTQTQAVLDAGARARECSETGTRLLPWRTHIFHRPQGGFWVCVDPSCDRRDAELAADDSNWGFGAVWLKQRDRCDCGAPVFELFTCNECGTPHLVVGLESGVAARLVPLRALETDDFSVDAEPDAESDDDQDAVAYGRGMLLPGRKDAGDQFLRLEDGMIFDNTPPSDARWVSIVLKEDETERDCCPGSNSENSRLAPQRYGPPFFMGVAMPASIESLAQPFGESGRPMGGRRALTFSDSRQGTARLAAKLQQDSERSLTRAFLYHYVQENKALKGEERVKLEERLEKFEKLNDPIFAEYKEDIEKELLGQTKPIEWKQLIERFAQHEELREFATEVWRERAIGGREMADDPEKLAEMFLYRELLRRSKVQNSAETMGLVRLSFPDLETKARACIPHVLAEVGLDEAGWKGVTMAAIDFVFRDRWAVNLSSNWMMSLVKHRWGGQYSSVCPYGRDPSDRPANSRPWPGPIPQLGRPSRLHRLVYALIGGDFKSKIDQDRAGEVLSMLWDLIVSTVARDMGGGAYRLDYSQAAVVRLDEGWICPVTRRVFGYSPGGRSPYDSDRLLEPIVLPRLDEANPGGLDPDSREKAVRWCEEDACVAELRRRGFWTDFHDRAAVYAPFLRAQEHTAQIERPVLAEYERKFKEGRINLLNCSTTMEMGIDIPDVQLIANSNAPPAISNYRQRLGRAGRRGEPWAFGITFCKDLPLDWKVFEDPRQFLMMQVSAPAVRLDSPGLVARHVHAALLGAFLRDHSEGLDLRAETGTFFAATDDASEPVAEGGGPADAFLVALRSKWNHSDRLVSDLKNLTKGTVLEGRNASDLTDETAQTFEKMLHRWHGEYAELLVRRDGASDEEVKRAFAIRARRMKGEFLLADLARRGFTPAYGFPVDVVPFDHLSGHIREKIDTTISFGGRLGGASRTLDMAIREYAPGAEVVVDGLVHRSEGVLPAWVANADASRLEDMQFFWECSSCLDFGLVRMTPEICEKCGTPGPDYRRSLRPAGFLGRRTPHTGYENLGHAPYEMPRLSASDGNWQALPDPNIGRWRADPTGRVVTLGSGPHGKGYALCLNCGRAEAEAGEETPLSEGMKKHKPLALAKGMRLAGGYCPGGFTKRDRVHRNVRLIHEARTDVFELQLPAGVSRAEGLALAAGLREALADRLGAEAREIGVSAARSKGPAKEDRVSAFLYDRASGGAGLSSRLTESEWFDHCLTKAYERLSCPENCEHGCPACVLRSDLNFGEERLDRQGGLECAKRLKEALQRA